MANPPLNRGRQWGEYFIPKLDNAQMAREIDTESYSIPPALINLIQNGAIFQGLENEDPAAHIASFAQLCSTTKLHGVTHDQMKKMLFPFSLRGQALSWFHASGCASLESFDEVIKEFAAKYYPPSKIERLRNAVANFKQMDGETFTESWERFQELCRKCPSLVEECGYELQHFYKGLTLENKGIVNASAGGSIIDKTYEEVRELFQKISKNGMTAYSERLQPMKRQTFALELDETTGLKAQLAALTHEMNLMKAERQGKPMTICGLCEGNHYTD